MADDDTGLTHRRGADDRLGDTQDVVESETIRHQRGSGEALVVTRDSAERTPAAIVYRIGGREYPMRSVPQCKTCQSHYRVEVENAILRGFGYAAVARHLPEQAKLTAENVRDHVTNGHMPIEETVRRALLEQRAEEVGYDEARQTIVDQIGFARVGLQRVFEQMSSGKLEPDISHGIAFARLLQDAEASAGGEIDRQMMLQGFMAYQEAIVATCTPEQVREISRVIKANPVLANIRSQRHAIEAEARDADA